MLEAFTDMDGINVIEISQGNAHFVGDCSASLITESADRGPGLQFPVYFLG